MFDLSFQETRELISSCMKVEPMSIPVYVQGPPGCGKSSIVNDLADDIAVAYQIPRKKVVSRTISLTSFDAVDIRGLPVPDIEAKVTTWLTPFIFSFNEDDIGILLFDELASANPIVQVSIFRIMLERRLDSFVIPEGIYLMAAGNRKIDQSVVFDLPAPLRNRMMIVTMVPTIEDFTIYAIKKNFEPSIVSFLNFRDNYLFNMRANSDDMSFATPRSWEFVNNFITSGREKTMVMEDGSDFNYIPSEGIAKMLDGGNTKNNKLFQTAISGLVGKAAATEYITFRAIEDKLPKMEDILAAKEYKIDINEMGVTYAIAGKLASHLNKVGQKKMASDFDLQKAIVKFIRMYDSRPEMIIVLFKTFNQYMPQFGMTMSLSKDPVVKQFMESVNAVIRASHS